MDLVPELVSLLTYDPATWQGITPRQYIADQFLAKGVSGPWGPYGVGRDEGRYPGILFLSIPHTKSYLHQRPQKASSFLCHLLRSFLVPATFSRRGPHPEAKGPGMEVAA